MRDKDVKLVEKVIDDNPVDDFWSVEDAKSMGNDPNSVLFEDILVSLSKAGMDLVLVQKKRPLRETIEELFKVMCPEGTITEEYMDELSERDIGYMDEGSFGEYSSEELIDTFAGGQNKVNVVEWCLISGMYYWRNLAV